MKTDKRNIKKLIRKVNRNASKLNSTKASKIAVNPSDLNGPEGSTIVKFIPGKGLHLMYRYSGKWYGTLLEKINHIDNSEDRKRTILKPGFPKHANEITYDTGSNKIMFRKGTSLKQVIKEGDNAKLQSVELEAAASTTTVLGGADLPVTGGTARLDSGSGGGTRSGVKFESIKPVGTLLVYKNVGSENIAFNTTEATSLLKGVAASYCAMEAGGTYVFVSDGSRWVYIGGGTNPPKGLVVG